MSDKERPVGSPHAPDGEQSDTFKRRNVRDNRFSRYYADSSVINIIGSEFEVGFISISPLINEIEWRRGSTQPVSTKKTSESSELCRVRMDGEAAYNLAFNLLLALVSSKETDLETVRENINMIESHVAAREATNE